MLVAASFIREEMRWGLRAVHLSGSGAPVLKVSVNLEKCFGHARCEDLCPEVFATDPVEGKCVIKNSEVPPELEKKVLLAVRNCPEFALQLSESESKSS